MTESAVPTGRNGVQFSKVGSDPGLTPQRGAQPHPCDDSRMTDWLALTAALRQATKAHAPEWTDSNEAGSGRRDVELFAFLSEGLLIYRGAVVPGGTAAASRIVAALDAYDEPDPIVVRVNGRPWQRISSLAEAGPDDAVFTVDEQTGTIRFGDGEHGRVPPGGGVVSARYRQGSARDGTSIAVRTTWPPRPGVHRVAVRDDGTMQLEAGVTLHEHWCRTKRPRYFDGRMLTADDLTEEQTYHRDKHRRHLQSLHGSGIVSGLNVAVGTDGGTLTIEPGLAIDPFGRELCVAKTVALAVPAGTASPSLVPLDNVERLIDPMQASSGEVAEPSRIEEGCGVIVAPSAEAGVALSRIVRESESWKVDASFDPSWAR